MPPPEKKKKNKNRKIVKILTHITTVVLIFAICVVPVFANSVNETVNVEYICGGSPLNMSYVTLKPSGDTKLTYAGYAPAVNQYIIDETNINPTPAPVYSYGIVGDSDFRITYENYGTAGANQFITFDQPTIAPQWSTNTPCVAHNYDEIVNKGYNLSIGVYKPHSVFPDYGEYVYATEINVRYIYNVTYHEISPEGQTETNYYNVFLDYVFPVHESGWASIPLYYSRALNADFFDRFASFVYKGDNYVCINSATILLMEGDDPVREGIYSKTYFIEPSADDIFHIKMSDYQRRYREDLSIIGDTEKLNVQFDDVNFVSWLKKGVGGFMDFEIVPGISFAGILAVMLGIPLLIWFLKMFAGG